MLVWAWLAGWWAWQVESAVSHALLPAQPDIEIHLDKEFRTINLTQHTSVRIFATPTSDRRFLVFESHCRTCQLVLSYTADRRENGTVVSSGAALAVSREEEQPWPARPGVVLANTGPYTVTALARVRAYTELDPVPGWCGVGRGGVWPRPFLTTGWNSASITVNFSRASLPGTSSWCRDPPAIEYHIYHRYLAGSTWFGSSSDPDTQWEEGLRSFSDQAGMEKHGRRVTSLGRVDRLVFASYPPTPSLYAVVARHANSSSLYGLAHSYGCQPDPTTGYCPDPARTPSKLVCATAIFTGLVMAFAGHKFFLASQFLFGFLAGAFIGFIVLSNLSASLSYTLLFCLTGLAGAGVGLATAAFWFFCGIPVLSVLLPTMEVGVILASCLLYIPQLNTLSLTSDLHYWLVFTCFTLATPITLLAFTQKASILACVIVGTAQVMLPVDYYAGTHLRFIFLNVVRRATQPSFSQALLEPPLDTEDLVVLAAWLGLASLALLSQLLSHRSRPPFPPAPYQQWRWRRQLSRGEAEEEAAPLLGQEEAPPPVVGYILGRPTVTGIAQASPAQTRCRDIFKPPSPLEQQPAARQQSI